MRAKLWALPIAAAGIFASAAGMDMAILGAPNDPSWNNDVRAKLLGSGVITGNVDIYNVSDGNQLPSLSTLSQYCAILAYTDGVIGNNVNPLGDLLAD